jgi:hypothetical protein
VATHFVLQIPVCSAAQFRADGMDNKHPSATGATARCRSLPPRQPALRLRTARLGRLPRSCRSRCSLQIRPHPPSDAFEAPPLAVDAEYVVHVYDPVYSCIRPPSRSWAMQPSPFQTLLSPLSGIWETRHPRCMPDLGQPWCRTRRQLGLLRLGCRGQWCWGLDRIRPTRTSPRRRGRAYPGHWHRPYPPRPRRVGRR